jgi:hypothetical protein
MTTTTAITLGDELACARAEFARRQRTYPDLVTRRHMTDQWADFQLTAQEAIVARLERLHRQGDTLTALEVLTTIATRLVWVESEAPKPEGFDYFAEMEALADQAREVLATLEQDGARQEALA